MPKRAISDRQRDADDSSDREADERQPEREPRAGSTTRQIGRVDARLSGSKSREPCRTRAASRCGVFGRILQPNTLPPASGPSALYSSHTAATSDQGRGRRAAAFRMRRSGVAISVLRPRDVLGERRDRPARRRPASVASLASCWRYTANWSTPRSTQLVDAADVLVDRAEEAEAVDDLVGHELGVHVAGLAVLVVVVARRPLM